MRPESFVPEIVRRFDRDKTWAEWLSGSVLFADVSGFTPMAEVLSVLGAEGETMPLRHLPDLNMVAIPSV